MPFARPFRGAADALGVSGTLGALGVRGGGAVLGELGTACEARPSQALEGPSVRNPQIFSAHGPDINVLDKVSLGWI